MRFRLLLQLNRFCMGHTKIGVRVCIGLEERFERPRGRHAHGKGGAIADGPELTDGEEPLVGAGRHLREEEGTVAGRVHHLPVGRQCILQRLDHRARIVQASRTTHNRRTRGVTTAGPFLFTGMAVLVLLALLVPVVIQVVRTLSR